MSKLPFEYVSKNVNELYEKKFDLNDVSGIDEHCQFIETFIRACGWEPDDLFRAMSGAPPLDNHAN